MSDEPDLELHKRRVEEAALRRGRVIASVEILFYENGEVAPAAASPGDGSVDLHDWDTVLGLYQRALAALERQIAGMGDGT